jgi:hypothetical protein
MDIVIHAQQIDFEGGEPLYFLRYFGDPVHSG